MLPLHKCNTDQDICGFYFSRVFVFFVIYRLEYPSCKGFYFIYFLLWDDKKIIQDSRAEHKYSIRIGNVIYLMFTHYVDFHNSKPSTLYHMPSSIHKVNKQRKLNKQEAFWIENMTHPGLNEENGSNKFNQSTRSTPNP